MHLALTLTLLMMGIDLDPERAMITSSEKTVKCLNAPPQG